MKLTRKEEELIREHTAALIEFMASLEMEKQQRAYDYLVIFIERALDK